jgi:hypothetical protein
VGQPALLLLAGVGVALLIAWLATNIGRLL